MSEYKKSKESYKSIKYANPEIKQKSYHPEILKRNSKINNIQKFDALFFGIYFKQDHTMNSMNRIILKHTYETIVDAGFNSENIHGTRTGVFIDIMGSTRNMMPQNISFWLSVTGPFLVVDSGSNSSL
ncbi:hypothetical protein HZH68_003949 [Vespula germanica]|uniref:Beta-ketoacyl synthase-like N-terminal domain-containing protein n=1 Tax=Vespula germanica TaxID=30212 RepID=A0A834KMS4_VESGE|nr:hypothetical protein HZH68_003949 [Vespula germanica]